ncbi:MAG: pyrroline-5-carboxylate reductase [bacterium]
MKLGFIGAGRMADAILRGLISSGDFSKNNMIISDKDIARSKQVSKKYDVGVAQNNAEAAGGSDVIVLAVKPQSMHSVLSELAGKLGSSQLVISIAAGITLKSMEKYLAKVPVVRVMPNNPCLIGEGISAICGGKFAQEKDLKTAEKIFSCVGDTMRVEEKQMNAVTALSGSGPAFIYEVIDALVDGGIEEGLSKSLSSALALKTALGSIKTVIKTKISPEELKNMVASPGGTTVAGLRVLEEAKFKGALKKAVIKASARAKEISEDFEKSL